MLLWGQSTHLLRVPCKYQYPTNTACPHFHKTQIEREKDLNSLHQFEYELISLNSFSAPQNHVLLPHLERNPSPSPDHFLSLFFIGNANLLSLRQLGKLFFMICSMQHGDVGIILTSMTSPTDPGGAALLNLKGFHLTQKLHECLFNWNRFYFIASLVK